jgi:broad specificity phosphatase PhoE/predicted kinase
VNEQGQTPIDVAEAAGYQTLVEHMILYRSEADDARKSGETPDSYERHHPHGDPGGASQGNSFGSGQSPSVGGYSAGVYQQHALIGGASLPRGRLSGLQSRDATGASEGHVLVMVGLPARGKSFVARRMVRYWRWRGVPCEVYHFGRYRREIYGAFDRTQGTAPPSQVEETAKKITADAAAFAIASGGVAIIDGTNTVAARRHHLWEGLLRNNVPARRIIFVEIVRNDPHIVHGNVLRSYEVDVAQKKIPDTAASKKQFVDNYYAVVRHHQGAGRPLDVKSDLDYSFVRLVNHNHLTLHRIEGVLPTRLVYFLHNLWFEPHTIYMCVTGEWTDLVQGRLGGNSELTENGKGFAAALAKYMAAEVTAKQQRISQEAAAATATTDTEEEDFLALMPEDQRASADAAEAAAASARQKAQARGGAPLVVMSSVQARARYTVAPFEKTPELEKSVFRFMPTLDDLSYGECDGQTPAEVRQTLPKTLDSIESDPYNNPWPNGESVRTMFESRLEQHIHEVHSIDRDVLIVAHRRVIQGLLYFFDEANDVTDPARALDVAVPLHHVFKLSPHGASRRVTVVPLGVPTTPGYTPTAAAPLSTPCLGTSSSTPSKLGTSPTTTLV